MRGLLVGLAIVFSLGVAVGNANDAAPDVKYKVIHDTKTVTETETVEVPIAPPAECLETVQIAKHILKAGKKLDVGTSELLDIISNVRLAAAMADPNSANDLETQLRHLQVTTIGASEKLGLLQADLIEAANACKEGY